MVVKKDGMVIMSLKAQTTMIEVIKNYVKV